MLTKPVPEILIGEEVKVGESSRTVAVIREFCGNELLSGMFKIFNVLIPERTIIRSFGQQAAILQRPRPEHRSRRLRPTKQGNHLETRPLLYESVEAEVKRRLPLDACSLAGGPWTRAWSYAIYPRPFYSYGI